MISRTFCTFFAAGAAFLSGAAEVGFTPEQADKFPYAGGRTILIENFDSNANRQLPKGCRIVPIAGVNGTSALQIDAAVNNRVVYHYPLRNIRTGEIYEVRLKIRTSGLARKPKTQRNVLCAVEQMNAAGKIVYCDYPIFQQERKEYTDVLFFFSLKPGNTARFSFNAWHNWHGTAWYDDLSIKSAGKDQTALLRFPAGLIFRDKERYFEVKTSRHIPAKAMILVTAEQEGKVVQRRLLTRHRDFVFNGTLPKLRNGKVKLTLKVIDPARKVFLYSGTYNMQADDATPPPANAVTVDRHGRVIVDGKPFMPLGVYGLFQDEHLKRISEAGFNCAQIYSSFSMHGPNRSSDAVANVRNRFDAFQRYNLKLIFSFAAQLPGSTQATNEFAGAIGPFKAARKVAQLFRDHPALLAYYVSDEASRSVVPDVQKLREMVSAVDPWHPTWTLTYRMDDLPYYGVSGDIIGVDPYPIKAIPGKPSMDIIVTHMEGAKTTGLPIWVVPQIMNYGVYTHKRPADFAKTRGPTMEEMRAMPLLCAIMGAKGFIFYSYIAFFFHAENISPGYGAKEWPKVVAMAKVMRSLEEFILSTEPEIPIKISSAPAGRVRARLFKSENGKYALVIAALGPDPAQATIQLPPGVPPLKSQFGRTTPLGGNRYLFKAKAIDSDILR